MKIQLANPRGFCAGVDRAIEIVNRALVVYGAPVYVRHEVVHNKTVVAELKSSGAIFVDELDEVPEGALVIFSAHGVSQAVRREADARNLKVFDATCPLVTKVHLEVTKLANDSVETILIGHAGHPEVEGTLGQYEVSGQKAEGEVYLVEDVDDVQKITVKNPDSVSYVTQTTLSVDDTTVVIDALRRRFPLIKGPRKDDICYATQNRQDAVKKLAATCDLILVVGSANSSNSNRLRELAERLGTTSYLIDDEQEIQNSWLASDITIGVTSGASAPESLVQRVIQRLEGAGATFDVEQIAARENLEFSLPRELRLK
jgi:4-hydroxy-3-methylbut-2-en-1-yl diphosphate reductase